MADWQLVEEGMKRGYSLDEVTDIIARDEGVDPVYARERGFDSSSILGRLGYAKPEATKPEKGFIGNVLDQAAHGVKTAYQGLLSAPGVYAGNPDAESIAGTIQAEQSHEKPKEMREAEAAFADVSKRQSDFESVYGKDSGYMDSIGKIMDMLVTTGKEIVANPKGMAYEMASQSGNMVAPIVGAYAGGKTGAVTGALLGPKGAVAGGVVGAGAGGFAGSHVMEQSGEFRGKVAERLSDLGLEPTAENVSAIFQDKAWLDKALEETRDKATGTAVTDGVLAAIGGLAVNAPIRAAQKTARAQLGATATAKQVSDAASDILASQPKWQKVAPHLKAGAIGWGGEPISEAAGQQYGYGHIDYGDVGMEAFAAAGEGIGSVYAAAKGMRTNPTPPANVTPSPSITSAPTTDGAIKAFQDEVDSVTPRGSFGSMDDLAGLIESERSDLGKRRGLLAQQQQDARDMENEFNGLVKDEQIDQSYRLNDAQNQREADRLREGDFALAEQQREEQQGRTVEQQVAASEAQGFGEQEPTAMQLAMQLAKQKALDSEFDGLLKQERTSINELRANVKKVAGVPVESISTPQLEEIAQSEAHPNTKMAAISALNDRHDAIQQERERLMQMREARLEQQANQPQGERNGEQSQGADGRIAVPGIAGRGADVSGGGLDAAMVNPDAGMRGIAGAGSAVSSSGQAGVVPVADQAANVRALTENAAKRQATQLTNQGYQTVAYPHPTQAGMWAIGSQDEVNGASIPAPSATQNDVQDGRKATFTKHGDFWNISGEIARDVAKALDTTLLKGRDGLPMVGIPDHAVEQSRNSLRDVGIAAEFEPPAVEVRSPVKRKRPASNNIAQAIINMGGVSTSLKNDILGDAATRTRPGMFTTNGTTDLGALAYRLAGEFGFSQIDVNDPTDNSGAKQLADLIARAVDGESILNEEAMIRAQEAEEVARYQDDINRKTKELGINPSGRGRPFSKVEAEVLKAIEVRLNKEIEEAGEEVAAARDMARQYLDDDKISEIEDKIADSLGENPSILEIYRALSAGIKEAINENVRNQQASNAEASRSDGEDSGAGSSEEESLPAFDLAGQTEAEARAEQERLNQPEGPTKEQIDREATAPFSLDGGTLAPEGSGVQGSMLTPDGRVSKDAEAKPAENKPTREFIGTGDKLYSESGRALAPAPKIETGTDRKINASTKRMNAWLLDEARKEAEANGNDWQQTLLRGIDANKMQKPDQDTVNDILFGDPDGPQAKHRAPHEGTVETPREAQSILKPLNPDAEAIAKADADLDAALGDLGDIIGQNFRMNFTPEQEQKIIPVLTRLFDAAFRKGYYTFKDAARFVLDIIKAKFGGDIEEQITLDHLQGAYIGMAGRYRDQGADSARVVVAVENKKELEVVNGNDQHRGSNLERDSQDANVADGMGEEGVRNERGGNRDGRGSGIQDSQGEGGPRGGVSVSGREAVSSRERGDLEIYTGAPGVPASTAGNGVSVGSDSDSFNGSPIESDSAGVIEEVAESGLTVEKAKLAQLQADKKEHTPGLDNIRETLPILTEGQQEDVYIAETRFAKPDGYGMLFTNGTGTGKTFTGLGVIKRFVTNGKDNIIVVVPNDKILSDWQKSGKLLGLNISQLANTQSAGSGVVITTYANFGQNNQLAHRNWDLIVHDEAHYLKMDSKGSDTLALKALQAISLHPDGAHVRHSMLYADDIAKLTDIQTRLKDNIERGKSTSTPASEMDAIDAENDQLSNALDNALKRRRETFELVREEVKAKQGANRPRALFLSATPFAYEKAVDWANGFLFDYDEGRGDDKNGSRGYNAGSNRDQFFLQHFGYRMRFGKLTQPDAKVDSGLMQRQFNSWLKKSGALSGRMLDVKADYDRRFVLVESAIGQRIDEALQWFSDQSEKGNKNPGLRDLRDTITDNFSYLQRRYLLEAIKAKEVIPHVKEHLALGRKVVVFHDYKKGGGFNPFNVMHKSGEGTAEYNAAVDMFRAEFKDLIASHVWQSSSPIATFQQEFPGVLLFNGDVPSKQRRANVEKFQDDDSGPQVILVQSAAGKEGISLHDTTGKHQRVLFNLGQPTQPTTAIQQEGRIYRTGQKSDAIFRYLNTGTNWEKWAFATTIAQRASAAENLGMGEQARALKDAFIAGFEESDDYRAGMENEGKGGKERDKAANSALTEYDRAKAFYFGTQKKNNLTKAQEGTDYFATPEPVGLKMMELADIRPGESVLEPSAGHGAIARWAPDTVEKTAIEPSMTLRPRLAMVFDGKILGQTFEELHVSNKYDAIVMNPPFGSAGRTAIDHLAKAATHLRDGGRIVALIPTGPSADAKFEKWLYEDNEKPIKPLYIDPNHGPVYKGDTLTLSGFGSLIDIVVAHVDGEEGRARYVRPAGYKDSGAVNITAITKVKPTGKRTESFSPTKGFSLVADINLPQVTFERAGTKVATRIVVIERSENAPQQTSRDYSDVTDIGTLFDRIEHLSIQPRAKAISNVEHASMNTSKPVVDQVAAKAGAESLGLEIVEHTTKAGKVIRGVVRRDLTLAEAKKIDEYTFKKDGGYFIREKHLAQPSAGLESRRASNDLDFTQPRGSEPLRKTSFGYANDTHNLFHVSTFKGNDGDVSTFDVYDTNTGEQLGFVSLGLRDGQITTLVAIEAEQKNVGFGEQLLRSLVASNPDGIYIINMLPEAVPFWQKMGVSLDEHFEGVWKHGNGVLTEEAIQAARNSERGIVAEDPGGRQKESRGNAESESGRQADNPLSSEGVADKTAPANAGVSVSAPSESVRRIQAVVERFKHLFKGTSALDIRVVSTTFDIPARFRPSPFAEGVFHDDAGLVYLVTMNLRNQRGVLSENRAWQILLHECVGHFGLSQMMGEKFAGILKAVKQATSTKGRVTDETRNTFQPGDKDYATWDAVKLRYPDVSDSELAQEVLARMSETDPGSSVLGYAVATVRQWVRDVARAMGVNVMVSTSELRDLVAKASGYMRRGDNVVNTFGPLYSMSTGLESRAATVQPQGPIWSAPEMSRTDNIIYTMQDKNIDLKRVQQAIKETVGEIRDDIDAYLQEELFHGRAAKITEEFLDKEVNPLISLMRASNVSMEEMETFLWARHAKERNAQIAKINDEMPDGGSGLTNKQADDLMGGKDVTIGDKTIAGVKPARKKLLSDLAGRVDAITNGNRALLERYGLESAETLNAWDGAYQHYVPLHREDTDSHLAGIGTGQGYSVKGSSSKRATGSSRPVENILANLALQRERIITRGEKNRVAQALHGLAKEMPNADLWEVDVKPTMRTTAMIGGREQVVDAVDPNFRNKPNVVFARFNGEDRFVVFNEHNERAVRMAEALKNLDADDISHLLGEVSRWTRYFASINTQYNPIFGVTNLVRDVQTGLLNLKSTPLDGKQMEMAGGLVHALPAVFKALRADRKGQSATGTWAQLWEEFQEVGGQTGYRDMFRNSHERAEALQNALDPAWWQKTWWGKAATVGGILAAPEQVFVEKVGKPFMELLSDYNTMMENGIRLSAYKLALDSGMTKERAASLAKNLTVNFNRKGQAGRQVGAMYAFFNASVQGTARMAETLNHGAKPGELLGKAGKQIVYGGLMLGALQAMLLLAAGFDDEEPPEFVRDRNIIIPTGNGKYISIPLPLGFHVLPTIGRISIEFTAGGFKKPGEHLVHIMDVLLDSFNPIGNAGLSMQTLAPTVLDPVAALTENKDWSGRQIARQDFSKLNPTPGYTRAKDTASSVSRGLAYALNYLSGGGEYGIGIVSPTPDQIEYLIGQVTGGVGRELGKIVTTGEAIGTGEDLPPHKIPLVGRFYGDTMGQSSEASKFYGTLEKLAEHRGTLDRMKDARDVEAYREYAKEHPESRFYDRANKVQRELSSLRKLKRTMIERDADRAKIRQIEDRMKTLMARFNQSVSEQEGNHR